MRSTRRGIALITVMLLLTTVLYLVLALLIRSNSNLFTSGRQVQGAQAFYVADSAAREKAMALLEKYWKSADPLAAVAQMQATVNSDFPIYDATGAVVGYADITYSVDSPHLPDPANAFGSHSYVTVAVEARGSIQDSAQASRTTRAVSVAYNIASAGLPADVLDFAYFMNHWVWFTDFAEGQAQILGNTAANGNYDVLRSAPTMASYLTLMAGPGYTYGPTGTTYNNNPYTQLYLRSQNTGYDANVYGTVIGLNGNQSPPKFGRIPVPRNLSQIAEESGPYIQAARAQHGTLSLKTVRIDALGPPMTYTVQSTQILTDTGVYGAQGSGQKENVVLAGTVSSSLRRGDTLKVVSIDGPVVVKSNVVLQGFIEGRGTLYAGRNIYVNGNLTYLNPPSCYPSSNVSNPAQVPQPSSGDAGKDQVLLCASGSVVYGDVTNSSQWSGIMQWFNYVDPQTGQRINDNHEDGGLDGIVNSSQFNPVDFKENDGLWSVEIQDSSSGEITLADLPIVDGSAQVPSGWMVVRGSGEDADGNGRYTPAYDQNRDFLFATRTDDNGNWSAVTFNSSGFDLCPTGGYAAFCKPVTRVDSFVMANNAIAGWLGDPLMGTSGHPANLVFYGGEAGRQECMATQLNGRNQLIYQDVRFSQLNDIGAPNGVRISFAQWSEK